MKYLQLMRFIYTILALCLLSGTAVSQQTISIIPGKGAGQLKIGMTKNEMDKVLGTDYESESFLDHVRSFIDDDTTIDLTNTPPFVVFFDEALIFNNCPKDYPVYTVYILNGKVVYILFSVYPCDEKLYKKFSVEGVKFYESQSKAMKVFGTEYTDVKYRDYIEHLYAKKGMQVSYDEDKFTVVAIFDPEKYAYKQKHRAEMLQYLFDSLLKEYRESKEDDND